MLTVRYDWLGLEPGDLVLDLGCGAGRHAFEAFRRGARVVAFDYDEAELKDVKAMFAAHRRGRGRHAAADPARGGCANGDATRLPFPDAMLRPRHRRRGARAHPRRRGGDRRARPGAEAGRHDRRHRARVAGRAGLLGAVRRVPRAVRRGRPRAHLQRARAALEAAGRGAPARRRAPRARAALAVLVAEVRGRVRRTTTTRWCAPTTQVLLWDIAGRQPMATFTQAGRARSPTRSSASPSSSTPASPREQPSDVPPRCARRRDGRRAGAHRRRASPSGSCRRG